MASATSPKLVSAVDESGSVVCVYSRDEKKGGWQATVWVYRYFTFTRHAD
jgi:hypothetical protein